MQESRTYFDQVLTQLSIIPAQNQQERRELQQLLFDKLSYPSTQLALIHMNANRLGTLDLRHNQQKKQLAESKELNKDLKYCRCCALPEQPSLLSLCTSIKNIKNLRGLIRLLFVTYSHAIVLLLILFFVYCLYAIISNVKSCNYDPANLNVAYNSTQYMRQISSWVFQVSLLSNISCMTSQTSYDIQCWLAVLAIILLAIVFILLKYRKLKITNDVQKKHSSVQKLSIFIQNMPVNMTKSELEQQFKKYQKQLNKQTREGKKQIKIAKLNFAAPFYLSSSVFSHPEISKIQQNFKGIKKQFINLVKSRIKSPSFNMALQERIEIYKRVVLQNLMKKADEQKGVLTAPAFVTFQSSYNAKFLIQNNSKTKTIFQSDKCFHFSNANNGGKMRAVITRPAKPEEILWMNLGQERSAILKKKVIIYIISIIFLAGTAAGLYFFQKFNFEQSVKNRNSALLLSFVVSIFILVISYIITAFLFILTKGQRNITYIHEQMSLNHKANIFQICHFVLIPLIFHLFFTTRYTGIVSLSQTIFFLGIQNAFVMPALKLLDLMYLINRVRKWWFSRPIKKLELNQFQLNQKFEYIQLIFAIEASFLVRALVFTFFYAALQPIIVVFTIVGFFAMHWIEKYCILRRCTRPISASIFTRLSINKYLAIGPIIFAVGCLIWPYYIKKQFVGLAPSIVAIVISVILCVIPFQRLVKKFMERSEKPGDEQEQMLYSEIKDNGQPEYERMNYLTSNEAILQKNEQKMRMQQQNGSIMHPYIQIFQKLISSQGIYNTFSSIGHARDKNTNMGMQGGGKSNRIKQIEQVVYRTSKNEKRTLIKQILEHLRNNINRLKYKSVANDANADVNVNPSSSTHIIKLDSN